MPPKSSSLSYMFAMRWSHPGEWKACMARPHRKCSHLLPCQDSDKAHTFSPPPFEHRFLPLFLSTKWVWRQSASTTSSPFPHPPHNGGKGFLIKLQAVLLSNQALKAVKWICTTWPLIQMTITEWCWNVPLVLLSSNTIDSGPCPGADRCCTLQITLLLYSWTTREKWLWSHGPWSNARTD